MGRSLRLPLVLVLALQVHGTAARADVSASDLRAIDRDDAAAEAALAGGDLEAALRYFDYFGHEQEDFARATLEYRLARQGLGAAVCEALGRRAWARAARALGVPRHGRGGAGAAGRSVRREGVIVRVKNAGAANDVPYVFVDNVWKVSVREVLVTALRSRFGKSVDFEEADLHVLAGKTARVLRDRAGRLAALADDVRTKRVTTAEQLRDAVERIRREVKGREASGVKP